MTTSTAILSLGASGTRLPDIISTALAVPETTEFVPEVLYDLAVPAVPDATTIEALRSTIDIEPLTVTERRSLTQVEIDTLSVERAEIDSMEKYLKSRKAAHRAMVFNHLDVGVEESVAPGSPLPDVDDKGHYVIKGDIPTIGGHKFTRELRTKAPEVTAEGLRAVEDSLGDDVFSHEDYLACTTQVRVLDENKALLRMREKPGIVEAFADAAVPGKTSASMYKRK